MSPCVSTGEHILLPEIFRVRSDVTFGGKALSDPEAEDNYRRAIVEASRMSARGWELRAATSLARLWRSQRKTKDAHGLLAPAYDWFTEGFDTPDLRDAKTLLDELK